MKAFLAILVALALAGCSGSMANKPIDNLIDWSGLVKPQDAVPPECTKSPTAEPKMPDTAGMSAKDAARETRKVRLALRKIRRDYRRCQAWAKAQR